MASSATVDSTMQGSPRSMTLPADDLPAFLPDLGDGVSDEPASMEHRLQDVDMGEPLGEDELVMALLARSVDDELITLLSMMSLVRAPVVRALPLGSGALECVDEIRRYATYLWALQGVHFIMPRLVDDRPEHVLSAGRSRPSCPAWRDPDAVARGEAVHHPVIGLSRCVVALVEADEAELSKKPGLRSALRSACAASALWRS